MARFTKTRVAVSAGMLIAGVWGSSMALFTDSVDENLSFSSGTLDLVGSATPTLLSVTNMAPGDVAYAPLTLTNGGSLDLRWAMTSARGGDTAFADALGLDVVQSATCDAGTDFATPLATGTAGSTFVLGDPTAGADTGDQALAPAATTPLCFRATFPLSAGNALQGKSSTVTLTFAAEQTANNP